MKKALIISLTINAFVFLFFIGKRFYWTYGPPSKAGKENIEVYILGKASVQDDLPIDSTDIVFVGNSITEGFPVAEFFPNVKVKNRGVGSSKTCHILNRIGRIARAKPKKIFIEAGINDIADGISIDSIFNNYKRIVEAVRYNSPKTIVYAQSVFPVTRGYTKHNESIINLNTMLSLYCRLNNVTYIDVYPVLKSGNTLNENYTYDGIHLNGKGYITLYQHLAQYVN